jgi:hypothetical protein
VKRASHEIGGLFALVLAVVAFVNACHHRHLSRAENGGSGGSSSVGGMGVGGLFSLNFPGADAAVDATDEALTDPCGSACGPVELCDPAHLGFDDNCDGLVDEGCTCQPGAVHWCFEGDPSYRNAPGCFDGIETCTELGTWGPCIGGVQGVPPDNCFLNDTSSCHAITAVPFAITDLKTGTGTFSANALPGSESYTVTCPSGVSVCPGVMSPESFEAVQSGEYLVTYTKLAAGSTVPISCSFALEVSAPGLRIELSWEHPDAAGVAGVDLDLHVHEPVNAEPWALFGGGAQDCGWNNCAFAGIAGVKVTPYAPHWFPDSNVIPQAVNWDLQPIAVENTCYNDPRGVGADWAAFAMGCHNPRLDVDDITCDTSIVDPNDVEFCAPENTNIDYPPLNQWVRIGVHYYNNHKQTYDVHPEVKVFCNGALSADLGPQGYYAGGDAGAGDDAGAQPVTFHALDGTSLDGGNIFWIVADVAFTTDSCGRTTCVVQPIYTDPVAVTPYLTLDTLAEDNFQPPWPAPPDAADGGISDAGVSDAGTDGGM